EALISPEAAVAPVTLQAEAEAEPDPARNITGFVGGAFTNAYISRGAVQQNQGIIFQPYAELDFALFDNSEAQGAFFKKSYAYLGIWNSLHSDHGPGTLAGWYEFDWYVGAAVDIAGGFNLNLQYVEFISPANAFGTAKNVQLVVSYDDSELIGNISKDIPALKPYAQIFFTTDGAAATGTGGGQYLEVGINPSITFGGENATYPLTLTFPAAVGFGFDDFYADDEAFGFGRVGISAGIPLAFMNQAGYGTWSLTGGVTVWIYGDGVADYNKTVAGDADYIVSGVLGAQCNF
ncbi:MAG TPA: hypothetical protein VK324_13805, partial [Tepidisphaeraceae bacterium]|nr:hypothetical protein [Tepidisphaeraceae bacterium]